MTQDRSPWVTWTGIQQVEGREQVAVVGPAGSAAASAPVFV